MSFYQARAGVCRAGVTYAGFTPPLFTVLVAGVDRSINVERGLTIVENTDNTPSTATVPLRGFVPAVGNAISIAYASPNRIEFIGTIVRVTAQMRGPSSAGVIWDCECIDPSWLMNRYAPVLARYRSMGANAIVADILARFTDPANGFRVGYIDSSFGNIDAMDITRDTVSNAISRVAGAVNAYWSGPDRDGCISFYSGGLVDGNPLTATDTTLNEELTYGDDLTAVRTLDQTAGEGSTTSLPVAAGASFIPVDNTAVYSDAGGQVLESQQVITYGGRSMGSGAGFLTFCSGIIYDIPQGSELAVFSSVGDSAAQTALAAVLGGGQSGIITHPLTDGRLSNAEAVLRSTSDLALFKSSLKTVSWTETGLHTRAGKLVAVSKTIPVTISGSFRISSITKTVRVHSKISTVWSRRVTTNAFVRTLYQLLEQAR